MKKFISLAALLLLLLLGFSQQKSAPNDTEQALTKLENDWMTAMKNRNEKTLDKIMAPEFELGGTDFDNPAFPAGVSRRTWMNNTMQNLKVDSVHFYKMKITVVENVAVVQSKFYWKGAFRDNTFEDSAYLVDTWIKRKPGWQVINRLVTDMNKTK